MAKSSKAKPRSKQSVTRAETRTAGARIGVASEPAPYCVHPGIAQLQDWLAKLKDRTGKSLPEWLACIEREAPKDEKTRREWLKAKHNMGTVNASWLAERSVGKGADEDSPEAYLAAADRYVEAMYAGKRAALVPLYDRLLTLGLATGKQAKACPCKTMVPLYRNHVFAQIKPATNSRIDLGLALATLMKAGKKLPKRLIDTGGFAKRDRITHKIEITAESDIDADVQAWLARAYELDAD